MVQAFGYMADGFFQKSDDLNGDGIISTSEMKELGYPVQNFHNRLSQEM